MDKDLKQRAYHALAEGGRVVICQDPMPGRRNKYDYIAYMSMEVGLTKRGDKIILEETLRKASHIVKCVNNFDKLVEALEGYHNAFKNSILPPNDVLIPIRKKAKETLQQVKGE